MTKPFSYYRKFQAKVGSHQSRVHLSEKCERESHQIGVWVGLIADTIKFELRIPDRKLEKLHIKLDHIIV